MINRISTRVRFATAIAVSAFLVTGCNRGDGAAAKKTIAFVPKAMDSEFWLTMRSGAQKAIEGRDDVVLSVLAPDREINVDQQVSILEDQIQRGAKALVVAPAGSAQVMPVLQDAIGRGIPVVLVDSDAPLPGKSSYAGTDNRAGGTLAGKHVIEKVGAGKIAIITGVPGNQSQDDRAAGFLETIATVPGLQLVTSQPANSERSQGLTVMENILTAHPDIKAVFATNDQMALGAVEAIMARSPKAGIFVVGFDATAEAVQAIIEGRMSASIAQRPFEMGRRSVEAALALIDGKKVEPRIDTGTELVTTANAQGYEKVTAALLGLLLLAGTVQATDEHRFTVAVTGEAVAIVTAACDPCDWGIAGQEAVLARVRLDGAYSQHLLISRGATPVPYRILLGPLTAGEHRLVLERDTARSAKNAGAMKIDRVEVRTYAAGTPEHEWLAQAPFVHARPGTVERFSDLPIHAWAERAPAPAVGFRYSIIFSHEDGGTPTDRLMATWGRTTDVEFVYGTERTADGVLHQEIQARNHDILPFAGRRLGSHPLLWVSTDNNMVSDSGPEDAVRFGLAPEFVSLENVSREVVMDKSPWTYAVMSAELRREGRIDPAGKPGSAKIPDPRRFAYLEGCGELTNATLAFDIGVSNAGGETEWFATDRGDYRFRIARSGCFRAAVPLAEGVKAEQITAVRLRAYTRPRRDIEPILPAGTGRVTLQRFNGVFMLDESYRPGPVRLQWSGVLEARGESDPVSIPASAATVR